MADKTSLWHALADSKSYTDQKQLPKNQQPEHLEKDQEPFNVETYNPLKVHQEATQTERINQINSVAAQSTSAALQYAQSTAQDTKETNMELLSQLKNGEEKLLQLQNHFQEMQTKLNEAEKAMQLGTEQLSCSQSENDHLKVKNTSLTVSLLQVQTEMQNGNESQNDIQLQLERLCTERVEQEQELLTQQATNSAKRKETSALLYSSQKDLVTRTEELGTVQNKLNIAQKQLNNMHQVLNASNAAHSECDETISAIRQRNSRLQAQINLKKETQKVIVSQNTKAHDLELKETQQSLHTLQKNCLLQKTQLQEAHVQSKALTTSHTAALENAMQSLIRLCVVAPTVNVHLGDIPLLCKASMPVDHIRNLVQNTILPTFVKLFVQDDDNVGPDGKTALDTWLESLLSEMQSSIEGHLRQVFTEKDSTK